MSTNDVPGANPVNADVLAMGCWAEHTDGSLLFVESTENGRIIYVMFDPPNQLQYRDAMAEHAFKKNFSWKPTDPKSIKWTWHDKTPFPWDKVIKAGVQDGQDYASADAAITAAERIQQNRRKHFSGAMVVAEQARPARQTAAEMVADELHLQGQAIRRVDWEDRFERVMNRLTGAFGGLAAKIEGMGKGKSKGRSARR